jgi:hypothetical protein
MADASDTVYLINRACCGCRPVRASCSWPAGAGSGAEGLVALLMIIREGSERDAPNPGSAGRALTRVTL